MSTWAQPGRLRRPGRGLKTEEKSANSQFSKPPHTQNFGHPLQHVTYMTRQKLDPDAQRLLLEVTKQLITLSVAAIGVVSGLMFTTFKGTPYIISAQVSLFSFLLSAATSLLSQLAVVADALQDRRVFNINYPQQLLLLSWVFFVLALTSFVVFTWANLNL